MSDESAKAIALAEHAERQHQNERTRRIAIALAGAMIADGPFDTAQGVLSIRMLINRMPDLCSIGTETARIIVRALEALRCPRQNEAHFTMEVAADDETIERVAALLANWAAGAWDARTLALVSRLEDVLRDFNDEAPLCIGEAVMAVAALILSLSRRPIAEELTNAADTERVLVLAIGVLDVYEVKFDKELN